MKYKKSLFPGVKHTKTIFSSCGCSAILSISYGPYDILYDQKLISEDCILKKDIKYAWIIIFQMKLSLP